MTNLYRYALACLALVAYSGPSPAATSDQPPALESAMLLKVDGSLTIDEGGMVIDYSAQTPLEEPLRSALDRAVRTWQFEPVVVDGVKRRAKSDLRVILAAKLVGEKYELSVDNVITPGESDLLGASEEAVAKGKKPFPQPPSETAVTGVKVFPPVYPEQLLRAGVGGAVLLSIRVGTDGRAEEVAVVQSMLFDVKGRDRNLRVAVRLLEQSAMGAARRWTFRVPAAADTLVERSVLAPVEYRLGRPGVTAVQPKGTWRTVIRTPKRAVPWLPAEPGAITAGVADVENGEMVPVANALTLTSDVLGASIL